MQYTKKNLYIPPFNDSEEDELILSITPEIAGWELISFQARRLNEGHSWSFSTGENELAIVNLSGTYSIESNLGNWTNFGGRTSVFEGGLYIIPAATYSVIMYLTSLIFIYFIRNR